MTQPKTIPFGSPPIAKPKTVPFGSAAPMTKTGFVTGEPAAVKQSFLQKLGLGDINAPSFDMNQNTSGLPGTLAKESANVVKSGAKFVKGSVDFMNPVKSANTVKDVAKGLNAGLKESTFNDLGGMQSDQRKQQIAQFQAPIDQQAKDAATHGSTATSLLNPITANDPSKGKFLADIVGSLPEAGYKAITPEAAQLAIKGKGTEALASLANDPFQVAPALLMTKGAIDKTAFGETKAGKVIDKTISTIAKPVTAPVEAIAKTSSKVAHTLAEFGTSQATGLSPKTLKTIIDNPDQFSSANMANHSREAVGQQVFNALTNRIDHLSETGKGYEKIRNSTASISATESGKPAIDFPSVLEKNKINFTTDEAGNIKLQTTADSLPLNRSDITALEDFFNTYNKPSLSANAVLNARESMSQLAKYDATKTGNLQRISRDLRSTLDTVAKDKIPGLANLDKAYAPEVEMLKKLKTDYMNADGTFKDNALSKIANLTNDGRQAVLKRLERIQPGISRRIAILKAVEDINSSAGQKVGTYARGLVAGGGILTGNPAAIVGAILSEPRIATQILRGYGKLRGVPSSVINKVLDRTAGFLNTDVKNLNVGLSIKDVSAAKKAQAGDTFNRLQAQKNKLLSQGLSENHPSVKNIIKAQKNLSE